VRATPLPGVESGQLPAAHIAQRLGRLTTRHRAPNRRYTGDRRSPRRKRLV
jgi:hypothetical protein